MTISKSSNPLVRLFQAVAEVVTDYTSKDRAVNIGQVWAAVQKSLDDNPKDMGGDMGMRTGYVLDVYAEEAGIFAIITRGDGKLYKIPVTVDGESQISFGEEQEVAMDFTPVTGRQLVVKRQADGKVRWFAMPACTAVLNRSGEIDSRALFDSFVEYVDRTGAYPELDFFHLGERLLLGKADWVGRDGYMYCASGTFYDTPIAEAAARSLEENPDYWGLSIAYLPTREPETLRSEDGIEIPVYNVGINRFISLLPEDTAASILTSISTREEVNRMDKKMKEALDKLTGGDADLMNQFEKIVDDKNRQAEAPGVISRKQTATASAAETPEVDREITADDIKAVLASDEFNTALGDMVKAMIDTEMESRSQDDPEGDDEDEEEPTATDSETDETESEVLKELRELRAQVNDLSKTRDAAVQEVLNDLPARISRTNIVRPRATHMPSKVNANQGNIDMAQVAEATLLKMGATEQ